MAPHSSYLADAARPLSALAFVAPLVLLHELAGGLGGTSVLAGRDLSDALVLAGVDVPVLPLLLPGLALVVLLAAHLAARDPWRVSPKTLAGMTAESALLALPVMGLALIVAAGAGALSLSAGGDPLTDLRGGVALAIGAGVYEELLFRLLGIAAVGVVLGDVLRLPKPAAIVAAVVVTSVAFALYHYRGSESFAWPSFAFRTAAGVYLAAVYLLRGFGVAAGAHAAYDGLVLLMHRDA